MTDLGVAVVVEDDADVRNLVEAVLSQAGFEVHSAADGREGVDVIRRLEADVVTLDVGLPDIDGFEVLRRVRQFSDAYVVMLTARTDELDTLTALHTGADDFMTKPFRPRVDHRDPPTHARPERSVARGVQAERYLAGGPQALDNPNVRRHRLLTGRFTPKPKRIRNTLNPKRSHL